MPKVTEITYSRGETRQLKPYEPTNIHYSIKAELEDGDDPHEAYLELKEIVDKEVEIRLATLDAKILPKIVREGAKIIIQNNKLV